MLCASIIVPASVLSLDAWQTHKAALRIVDLRVASMTRLLSEQVAKVMETNELAIALVDRMLGDMSWDEIAKSEKLHKQLTDLDDSLPQIISIVVINPDDIVANSSFPMSWPRNISLADRPWVIALREKPVTVITPIYLGRVSHRMQFSVVKRRSSPDGSYNGSIDVSDPPDYFQGMFNEVASKESFALARNDGVILASYPPDQTVRIPEEAMRRLEGNTSVRFGEHGVLSRVIGFPLVVAYSVEASALLHIWLDDLIYDVIITALGALFVGVTCLVALHSYERESAAHGRLQLEMERRQEAETKMYHSRRMEALGQLTAGVAHDFNNLLTIIIGNAEQIVHIDGGLAGKAKNILTAALRGATLVGQMLSFSRRQMLQAEPYDLVEGLAQFQPMITSSLKPTVKLEMRSAAQPLVCQLDRTEFELAVLNIVNNADQAMPNGGQLMIHTEMIFIHDGDCHLSPGQYARLSFEDNGIGMSEAVRERVFEPFFTTRHLTAGTGLGLSQVYGFTRQSGGDVVIDSEPARGTKVVVYLPMNNAQAELAGGPVATQKLIVVVDDERALLDVIAPSLENQGYRVLPTDDPFQALQYVNDHDVALLLTDIIMPTLSGNELARRACHDRPQMKVLMMTGFSQEMPSYPVLRKPFRMAVLVAQVQLLLDEKPERWAVP